MIYPLISFTTFTLVLFLNSPTQVKKTMEFMRVPSFHKIANETPLGQVLPIGAQAKIAGQIVKLEVTRTPREQALGLMYRTSLPDHRGMLFSFNPPQSIRFWMKNCRIPLDMVFLKDGVVQYIAVNVPPCQKNPCPNYGPDSHQVIDQVIELRGGWTTQYGLKVGDSISLKFLTPQ